MLQRWTFFIDCLNVASHFSYISSMTVSPRNSKKKKELRLFSTRISTEIFCINIYIDICVCLVLVCSYVVDFLCSIVNDSLLSLLHTFPDRKSALKAFLILKTVTGASFDKICVSQVLSESLA